MTLLCPHVPLTPLLLPVPLPFHSRYEHFVPPQPLAIFVDNDGDEATVVVEVAGASRRNGQPFKTVFLHSYAVAAQVRAAG